jgi:hypothetical protein
MKKLNVIYLFLFILLVMGAFASMAQNSYGLKILGGVAFIFALLFFAEFVTALRRKENDDMFAIMEPFCLFVLSLLFGLRVFYIHFNYVEVIFAATAIVLAIIYLRKMMIRYGDLTTRNKLLSLFVVIFHLSIVFFLVSLAFAPFLPATAEAIGIGSFALLMIFIVGGFLKKNLLVEGNPVSPFQVIRRYKGHSIILVTLILMFSFYFGFNKAGLLPGVYSDEYPRAYFELLDKATAGQEKAVNGKYSYEEFMENYKKFVRRHRSKD